MNSPWGSVQDKITIEPGFYMVSTASHGGIMIKKEKALKILSDAAIKFSEAFGIYLCFEEDILVEVVLWELLGTKYDDLLEEHFYPTEISIWKILSYWLPDYLLMAGYVPNIQEFNRYQINREHDKLRHDKSPNFVKSAVLTDNDKFVKVWTADGAEHIVTSASYTSGQGYDQLLLENLEIVELT
jgi:hypothetical protein